MIKIYINDAECLVNKDSTIENIISKGYGLCDVVIYNTVLSPLLDTIVRENDRLVIFRKGEMPPEREMESFMLSRQKKEVTECLRKASVGIAGLGGLGSVVAENLARAGVGHLVIADYDVVEPSNLNRQRYFVDQIGSFKTDALKENLGRINPYVKVTDYNIKLEKSNIKDVFSSCNVVAECFDAADSKAELITTVRKDIPDITVVAASGVAGTGDEKDIKTHRISDRILVVGDMKTEVREGHGLVATRVGIAASIQSHVILRILTGDIQ